MSKFFLISGKVSFLCLLWILSVLPAAEAKQKQKTQVAEGTIRIVTDIPKLKVFINGEAEGLAHPGKPLVRNHIPAGEVKIRVRAKDYPEKNRTVRLKAGQTAEVEFDFLPASAQSGEKVSDGKDSKRNDLPVPDLLRAGDRYFRLQRYMVPEKENAFEMYKAVLSAEPKNAHAQEKVYEMIGIYKKMGAEAEDKNMERSFSAFQNCQTLLTFAVENLRDRNRKKELDSLKKKVMDMEKRIRKANELVKEGDSHFIAQRYTTPKRKNAFSLYKSALEQNPTHEQAKKRILEIARFYKDQAARFRQDHDKTKAEKYQRQYQMVDAYISENFGRRGGKPQTSDTRKTDDRTETGDIPKAGDKTQAKDMRKTDDRTEPESDRPAPDRSGETKKLLRQAEEYARKGQFAGSGEKNALYAYQQVLRIDPENRTGAKKIREMMKTCQAKGMAAFEKEKYEEAGAWFDQYLRMAEYGAESGKIPVPEAETAEIRQLRSDTENHMRGKELETVRKVLQKNYEQYRDLRTKEDAGANVTRTLIPLMREIIANLTRIEQIYQDFPQKDEDITQKTERVRNLRIEMEKETAVREARAY